MRTKGVVLCGGEGRRLKPLTDYFQKTMVPIGPKGRPLLEYVVRLLVWHKVKELTFLTGYMSEQIENYFGDGSRFDAIIGYSRDPRSGLGSATALRRAIESGKLGEFDAVLVYYGDVLSGLDISKLLSEHTANAASVTIVLSRKYALPVGVARISRGLVKSFEEKPTMNLNISTGCMVISPDAVKILEHLKGQKDLMSHFIPEAIKGTGNVRAFFTNGFWYDIGTTEAYERLDDRLVKHHLGFLG